MAKTKTERLSAQHWLDAALDVLADEGIAAVRVERLAERLGVSKGSFYWHFSDRPALLTALLGHWRKAGTDAVIEAVERSGLQGLARLERLIEICLSPRADRMEAALRAWSAHDMAAARVTARVDREREAFVARELAALGVPAAAATRRARVLYLALIGEYTWCTSGGAPTDRATFSELLGLMVGGAIAVPRTTPRAPTHTAPKKVVPANQAKATKATKRTKATPKVPARASTTTSPKRAR